MAGIFIIRGMTVAMPAGGLTIPADGNVNQDLQVHYDVVPVWLEIAMKHAKAARDRSDDLAQVWQGGDEDKKALVAVTSYFAGFCAAARAPGTKVAPSRSKHTRALTGLLRTTLCQFGVKLSLHRGRQLSANAAAVQFTPRHVGQGCVISFAAPQRVEVVGQGSQPRNRQRRG